MNQTAIKRIRALAALALICLGALCGCIGADGRAAADEAPAVEDSVPREMLQVNPDAYFPYLVFETARSQGDMGEARQALEEAIELDPASGYLRRELALLLIRQSRHTKALEVIEALLRRAPDDVDALVLYGRINHGMKRLELAKEAYQKAVDLDPARKNIFLLLGGIYMEAEDYAAAEKVYARLLVYFPDNFAGHFQMGKIQMARGDEAAAESSFLRTLQINPELQQPRFELIDIYRQSGRNEAVAAQYEALLERDPGNIPAALGYGIFLHRAGSTDRAGKLLRALGARSTEDNGVFRILIRDYLEKSRYADAATALKGMLAGASEKSDLHYLMGVALEGQKKYGEALADFLRIGPGERFYADAAIRAAFLYQELDRLAEGIAFLNKVVENMPDKAEFRLYQGTFYEEMREYQKAEAALKEGLEIEPDNVKIHFRLGVVYDKWGRKDQSIQAMKEVIRINPEHANALNYLGYTYADLGRNLTEAEELIQRALTLAPEDGYITDSLGWVYFKRGQFDRARQYLEKAVGMVPDDPVILEHLGDVYRKLGAPDKALETYRRSLKKKTEDTADLEKKIQELNGTTP